MSDNIKTLTRREVIRNVRKRWNQQYSHCDDGYEIGIPKEPISTIKARLRKLNLETCSAADVDEAIGTTGWAANECYVCEADVEVTICFSEHWGGEKSMHVCPSCMEKAAAALALTSNQSK
jgi:hypothetical protein